MEKIDFEYGLWQAPIGWLGLVCSEERLVEIISEVRSEAVVERIGRLYPASVAACGAVCVETRRQLEEYFHGRRRDFALPLSLDSRTLFTVQVLTALRQIPFGSTVTYGQLAALSGFPRAARAVGRAMAVNPFPIVIPCHRVLGVGGRLTGYSGAEGIATKQWLLDFEAAQASSVAGNERPLGGQSDE